MASPNTRIEQLEKQMALLMKTVAPDTTEQPTNSKAKAKAKVPKKTTKGSEDDKPKKKRTSGYILFSNANRAEVKEQQAEQAKGDEKPKNTEIMKELARMWKLLDDDEKAIWNNKAKTEASEDED